tara:strand:+ start:206 stop:1024 length:819 start_codon:yes stop_codon:yes gene_type:complete
MATAGLPGAGASEAVAREYVDLELVIATDVSRSIDREEALLQREGVAAAFRSQEVITAISSGVLQRIAVAYLDYSSRDWNKVVLDWRIIRDAASAHAFADALLASPLTFGRRTSISDAIEQAAAMIDANDIEGTRRVIDVSGDGPNNWGALVDGVRDAAIARRITINGLPIVNDRGGPGSRYNLPDLDLYYRGCVIGGPGAFLVVAKDFPDFARAIRRKLVLEIADLAPPPEALPPRFIRAAGHARPSPTGYVYEKGCDIGERMRDSWRDDP